MAQPALQRLLTKFVMGLPSPLLRLMSGGEALEISGRTLDPQMQMIAHAAKGAPKLTEMAPVAARISAAEGFKAAAAALEPGVAVNDLEIPAPGGARPARAYRPSDQDPAAPVFVYLHMGGGVIGDLETGHVFCSILAKGARCAVVSLDYSLAPEHPFPAGLDDSLAGFRWVRDHAEQFGAPSGLAAIGGDSMGGNFSAVIAQDLKARGEAQPSLQLLLYPATDLTSQTQSMTAFADAFPLTRETMDWFMGHYLPNGADPSDRRLSPLKSEDLGGLAPAIVITAGFDPLCDQGEIYAHKLLEAGTPALYRCYDSLAHGFVAFTGVVAAADIACREIVGMVRQGFDGMLSEATTMQALTPTS